ncbi:MAG: hypothetical protein WC785_04925 [Tatlockia sp.]
MPVPLNCLKKPAIQPLDNQALLTRAMQLPAEGTIALSTNKLSYLKIDNDWVHALYPYLANQGIQKPNYFHNDAIGAHISVIYPEENTWINEAECNKPHRFNPTQLVKATIGMKNYYVLLIEAKALSVARTKLGLAEWLNFKGYAIPFHITIGVEKLT